MNILMSTWPLRCCWNQ